jgi:hypothetical protein
MRLGRAVLAYRGRTDFDPSSFDEAADMLCGIATLHGLAHAVLEEKATDFFQGANAKNSVKDYLLQVVERLYPTVAY